MTLILMIDLLVIILTLIYHVCFGFVLNCQDMVWSGGLNF